MRLKALWIATWPIPSSVIFCSLIFKWVDCMKRELTRGSTYRNYKEALFCQRIFGSFSWNIFGVCLACNILEAQLTLENNQKPVFLFKVKQHYRIHVFTVLTTSTTLALHPMLTNQRISFHSLSTLGYYLSTHPF